MMLVNRAKIFAIATIFAAMLVMPTSAEDAASVRAEIMAADAVLKKCLPADRALRSAFNAWVKAKVITVRQLKADSRWDAGQQRSLQRELDRKKKELDAKDRKIRDAWATIGAAGKKLDQLSGGSSGKGGSTIASGGSARGSTGSRDPDGEERTRRMMHDSIERNQVAMGRLENREPLEQFYFDEFQSFRTLGNE